MLSKIIEFFLGKFVYKNDYRARVAFAWKPTELEDGYVWLDKYIVIEEKCYPRQDLPPHISVPDGPFWITVKKLSYPDVGAFVSTESILEYFLDKFLKNKGL